MARIYIIRHGKAAAGFDADTDPGLDDLGRSQTDAATAELLKRISDGPWPVISSPLKRCRETSDPLCAAWNVTADIQHAVAEIPSPTDDLAERGKWLRKAMAGTWAEAGDEYVAWRQSVVDYVSGLSQDTVIFSHFIAINALVSHCEQSEQMIVFAPDNCSITSLDVEGGKLTLIEKGGQAETHVN